MILPAILAMKQKQCIQTNKVYKWKACLSLDSLHITKSKDYDQTYSPVVLWPVIHFILTMTILQGWYTQQIDHVQVYSQALAKWQHIYMQVPKGFTKWRKNSNDYVLHIQWNLYRGKAAGWVWYLHLKRHLLTAGFQVSKINNFVFYYSQCIYILYVDDSIICSLTKVHVKKALNMINKTTLKFIEEGNMGDFLGIRIDRNLDSLISLT